MFENNAYGDLSEFDRNLAQFGDRVSIIAGLEISGKMTPEKAYQDIKLLYKELKKARKGVTKDNGWAYRPLAWTEATAGSVPAAQSYFLQDLVFQQPGQLAGGSLVFLWPHGQPHRLPRFWFQPRPLYDPSQLLGQC